MVAVPARERTGAVARGRRGAALALVGAALALATACGGETSEGGTAGGGAGGTAGAGTGGTAGGGAGTGGASGSGGGPADCVLPDGRVVPHGTSEPAPDGCNTCSCNAGSYGCTDMACPGCVVWEQHYPVGATYLTDDRCNTCTCNTDGQGVCTRLACQCDPPREWWRDYIGDAQTCQVIDYDCSPPYRAFSNGCGCGCQQDPNCPEIMDCMPPAGPDCQPERCPLSTAAL